MILLIPGATLPRQTISALTVRGSKYCVALGPALINFFYPSIFCPALNTQFYMTNSPGFTSASGMRNGWSRWRLTSLATSGQGYVWGLWICRSVIRLFTLMKGQMIFVIISSSWSSASSPTLSILRDPQRSSAFGSYSFINELLRDNFGYSILTAFVVLLAATSFLITKLRPKDTEAMPSSFNAKAGDILLCYAISNQIL